MEIWLKQGSDALRLPVLPSGYDVGIENNNTEVNISNFGTINLIGKRGLSILKLSSFFPNQNYSFCQYSGILQPTAYVSMIKSWLGDPIKVVITGTDINMDMTIEDFNATPEQTSLHFPSLCRPM